MSLITHKLPRQLHVSEIFKVLLRPINIGKSLQLWMRKLAIRDATKMNGQ